MASVASILFATAWVRSDAVDPRVPCSAGSPARPARTCCAMRSRIRDGGREAALRRRRLRGPDARPDRDDRARLRALRHAVQRRRPSRGCARYLAAKPKGRHGAHRYEFAGDGAARDVERRRFRDYQQRLRRSVGSVSGRLEDARITPERVRAEIARIVEAGRPCVMRPGDSPRVSADGFAYLAGLAKVALEQQLHGADPVFPRFVPTRTRTRSGAPRTPTTTTCGRASIPLRCIA